MGGRAQIVVKQLLNFASTSGAGGQGFEPWPSHTIGVKNGSNGYLAWCTAL